MKELTKQPWRKKDIYVLIFYEDSVFYQILIWHRLGKRKPTHYRDAISNKVSTIEEKKRKTYKGAKPSVFLR